MSTCLAPYTSNSEIDLHLGNHSADHYVAFKVKTIDPKRYEAADENLDGILCTRHCNFLWYDDKTLLTLPSLTHHYSYVVKPTSGIIAPGKEFTVKVSMQALANQDAVVAFAKSKQKFMVQYRSVVGTPDQHDTAAILVRVKLEL